MKVNELVTYCNSNPCKGMKCPYFKECEYYYQEYGNIPYHENRRKGYEKIKNKYIELDND